VLIVAHFTKMRTIELVTAFVTVFPPQGASSYRGTNRSDSAPRACAATGIPDLYLQGAGNCINAAGLTPTYYHCSVPTGCPATYTLAECGTVCASDDGCTGFEMVSTAGGVEQCHVFITQAPLIANSTFPPIVNATMRNLNWTVVAGTQSNYGRTVANVNPQGTSSCCYKNAYPRPNPSDNPVPMPPVQSPTQVATYANLSHIAAAAHTAALPALESLVAFCAANATNGGKPYNIFGAEHCPGMADLTAISGGEFPSASQILERFSLEAKAAEFGHGYEVLAPLMNMDNIFNPIYPWQMNLYQPCTLGLNITNADKMCGMSKVGGGGGPNYDLIQQHFFNSKPFTTGKPFTTNFHEATERIIYTATNFNQSPLGNSPYYGTWHAILKPKYIEKLALLTTTDSYHYEPQWPHCTGWANCTVGTLDYNYHLLYAWMTGGGPPGGYYTPVPNPAYCIEQMAYLTDMTCAKPPRRGNDIAKYTCPTIFNYNLYMEVDILGTVQYPDGIKLLTASFADHFGAWEGEKLRTLCLRNNWILAWVVFDPAKKVCLDPRRLIDPVVLANTTVNMTADVSVNTSFTTMWTAANITRKNPATWTATYLTVWESFINETANPGAADLLTWNIGAMACTDYDNCFGITESTGTCVCYQPAKE
jgi:hypothetical protein